jgi:hypothetical protein
MSPDRPAVPRGPRPSWASDRRFDRRVDLALIAGSATVVAAAMLLGTGLIPSGLYVSSGTTWQWSLAPCSNHAPDPADPANLYFPLWASVSYRWTADSTGWGLVYTVSGPMNSFVQSAVGNNSSGSFRSDGAPVEFWAALLTPLGPNESCAPTVITTTVTYSL